MVVVRVVGALRDGVPALAAPGLAAAESLDREPGSSGSAVHHLGYWTDDVASCSTSLEASGSQRAACGVAADGTYPSRFAYHRDPRGYFVEVVSTSIRAEMEARWQPGG